MKQFWSTEPFRRFEIRSASLFGACTTLGAASTVFCCEGLKSLHARRVLGLPEPRIEGKALSSFVHPALYTGSDILELSVSIGQLTALGACAINAGPPGAPEAAMISDEEFAAALRRRIDLLEV